MPIPSGFTIVTAPCEFGLAVEYVTGLFGPPAVGKRYSCSALPRVGPLVLASLVREVDLLAGTYLLQDVHTRGDNQDPCVCTFHYRWSGATDPAPADFAAVEARLDGFWNAVKGLRSAAVTGGEYRWYGPKDAPPAKWGEAIRVQAALNHPGTVASSLPHQVACSVTELTDVRRRWGRFYIPCMASSALTTTNSRGLYSDAAMTTIVDAADVAFTQTLTSWRLVVFGAPLPTSLEVRKVRVDQVPDIIRRRRYEGVYNFTRDLYGVG